MADDNLQNPTTALNQGVPQAPNTAAPVQQAAENLETLMKNTETVNKASVWGYLSFSLALPPITLVIALLWAWRRKVIYVILPSLTIAYSALFVLMPILIFFLFGPIHVVTTQFTSSQNIYSDSTLKISSIVLVLMAAFGIVLGMLFRKRAKQALTLMQFAFAVLITILVLEHAVFWVNFNSTLKVISKLGQTFLNQQGVPF